MDTLINNTTPAPTENAVIPDHKDKEIRSVRRQASKWLAEFLAGAICLLAALVSSWPLLPNLAKAIPRGTETEATVPFASLWSLWWNADRLSHGFSGYWDAPFFYPNQGVFAYSELLTLPGVLTAPLWWLNLSPALVYNLAWLGIVVFNGYFAYRLARALEISYLPAILAGVLAVTLPFVGREAGVLPVMALFGMLWTLEGLVRFSRNGKTGWAVWTGGGLVASYLSSQQLTLLFGPFALAAGLLTLSTRGFKRPDLRRLGLVALGSSLLLLPMALTVLSIHSQAGFQRSEEVVQALSARPADFFTRPATSLVPVLPPAAGGDTAGFFPGIGLVGLAGLGVFIAFAKKPCSQGQRAWIYYLVFSSLVAFLLALGLNLNLFGWSPFATLRALIPGLAQLRAPVRFAAIGQLALPLLAGFGLAYIQERIRLRARSNRHLQLGLALVLALGTIGALENLNIQAPLVSLPDSPRTAWSEWLAWQPENTVVAHVPFPVGLSARDYEVEAVRMFAQIDHKKPIVNGYSSYFPQNRNPQDQVVPTYTMFQLAMAQDFPRYELFCVLGRGLGVNTIVVDKPWAETHQAELDAQSRFLKPAFSNEQVQIYRLVIPDGECQTG